MLSKEFAKLKGCFVVEGNEYVFVPGKDFNEAASNAIQVFERARDNLGSKVYPNTYERFQGKDSVFQLVKCI